MTSSSKGLVLTSTEQQPLQVCILKLHKFRRHAKYNLLNSKLLWLVLRLTTEVTDILCQGEQGGRGRGVLQ